MFKKIFLGCEISNKKISKQVSFNLNIHSTLLLVTYAIFLPFSINKHSTVNIQCPFYSSLRGFSQPNKLLLGWKIFKEIHDMDLLPMHRTNFQNWCLKFLSDIFHIYFIFPFLKSFRFFKKRKHFLFVSKNKLTAMNDKLLEYGSVINHFDSVIS